MTDIIYRKLLPAEFGRIREIDASQYIARAWRGDGGELRLVDINWNETDLPNGFENHLARLTDAANNGGAVIGAFMGDRLVGFSSVDARLFGTRHSYALLDQLFVTRSLRGQGVGRELFMRSANAAKAFGAESLYISSASAEDTVAFYRAIGCKPASEPNKRLYDEDPRDIRLQFELADTERFRGN